jgi:hypothetical protein
MAHTIMQNGQLSYQELLQFVMTPRMCTIGCCLGIVVDRIFLCTMLKQQAANFDTTMTRTDHEGSVTMYFIPALNISPGIKEPLHNIFEAQAASVVQG